MCNYQHIKVLNDICWHIHSLSLDHKSWNATLCRDSSDDTLGVCMGTMWVLVITAMNYSDLQWHEVHIKIHENVR
jgi:hypothetical protein